MINSASALQLLWEILDGISEITILSLISVSVTGIANDLNIVLLTLS
jgi:hypothetical protein